MHKKALFGGDYNKGAGKSTSLAMRTHKMRTGKPKEEDS